MQSRNINSGKKMPPPMTGDGKGASGGFLVGGAATLNWFFHFINVIERNRVTQLGGSSYKFFCHGWRNSLAALVMGDIPLRNPDPLRHGSLSETERLSDVEKCVHEGILELLLAVVNRISNHALLCVLA
jgi:hypothetical protein